MMSRGTSPLTGVCMCKNGTYSSKCCKGGIINQGIGSLEGGGTSTITSENTVRTITRN